MIGFILFFILLNFLTIKLNQKLIKDYTKVRHQLKIKKQTYGSIDDPDHLYFFLGLFLMVNILLITIMLGVGTDMFGIYAFVVLGTYVILGLIQLFFNFDAMVTNCENISLNKNEFNLNVFWQIVINLICTVGVFVDKVIKVLGLNSSLPNLVPSISERLSKGSKSFDE